MLQFEGYDGAIARAREDRESDERAVAAFDLRIGRHGVEHGADLCERRASLVSTRGRNTREIVRRVEIIGVRIFDPRAINRFTGEPDEKGLQGAERRIDCRRR
jgi:hypothetical protein